jgi:hypothetical protein
MTDYSGTPLSKKLGIKQDFNIAILNEPVEFHSELGELPPRVKVNQGLGSEHDLILFFVDRGKTLESSFHRLARAIKPSGMLWISWPKKSSGLTTDLNFDFVQKTGLSNGLVDTKICAVNDLWSGLKFVYRLKDRPAK